MDNAFVQEGIMSPPDIGGDSEVLYSDVTIRRREDPDFLISAAAGYQASQGLHGLEIALDCPVLSPRSVRGTFRRGGRDYREAASEEFYGEVFSPRYSKDANSADAISSPRPSPRFASDTETHFYSGWASSDRTLRRSTRIVLEATSDGSPEILEIPDVRRRSSRRSSLDAVSPGRGVAAPRARRSSRFRALAQQII